MRATLALVLLLQAWLVSARKDKSQLVLHIKTFDDCHRPNTPNRINASVIMVGKGVSVINTEIDVKVPFSGGKFVFTLYKCGTECERTLKFATDYCKVFSDKGMPWSKFARTVQPEMKCPVKKGIYRFVNATMDASEVTKAGLMAMNPWTDNFDWKTIFEVVSFNEEILSCGITTIGFTKERNIKRYQ